MLPSARAPSYWSGSSECKRGFREAWAEGQATGGARATSGPVRVPQKGLAGQQERTVPGVLTWRASHPYWALASGVALGASGPREPPGTTSIWGRKLVSRAVTALFSPDPGPSPPASTCHLLGAAGPSHSLWPPVALGVGRSIDRGHFHPESCLQLHLAGGRGCWASQDFSAQGPLETIPPGPLESWGD